MIRNFRRDIMVDCCIYFLAVQSHFVSFHVSILLSYFLAADKKVSAPEIFLHCKKKSVIVAWVIFETLPFV